MANSLMELLEGDLGAGSVKTASAVTLTPGDDVSIEKIAQQLGLFGDSTKTAEFPPKKDDDKKTTRRTKKARRSTRILSPRKPAPSAASSRPCSRTTLSAARPSTPAR